MERKFLLEFRYLHICKVCILVIAAFKQYFFACLHARALDVRGVVAVYMAFVHHGSSRGKLALDNKWSSLGISDRDRFSTWQHISDDVAFTLAKSLSLCSSLAFWYV